MTYPPPVTKQERKVLEVVARGHPHRTMSLRISGSNGSVNALEWSEVQIGAGITDDDEFGNCIAHLRSGGLIDGARQLPGLFARISGSKERFFFWVTNAGKRVLDELPEVRLPETIKPPSKAELVPSDIDDAARIYENSLSPRPYVKPEEIAWATVVLDDDIKAELAKAAVELEAMWLSFQQLFGHRGAARSERERAVRDPVVVRTVVRSFRAKDEQRRRLGFPPSAKPGAWHSHYKGGEVGLEPAPWALRGAHRPDRSEG